VNFDLIGPNNLIGKNCAKRHIYIGIK